MKKNIFRPRNLIKIFISLIIVVFLLLRLEIIGQPIVNMSFRYSDKKLKRKFLHDDIKPSIKRVTFNNSTVRYLELTTDPNLPYVVFIHGAPGSSADYLSYFRNENLYTQVNMISVDRLGYGYSDFGRSVTSIQLQAEAIQFIISSTCSTNNITLVGHSYGGPIALKMAMDYPESYKNIILLAPALDPEHEKEIRIARLALIQPFRWLTPPALMVAADEKTTHVEELKKLVPFYHRVSIPVCHMHGDKDSLVPYENLAFSEIHIDPEFLESVTLENADHFLPWSHRDLIVQKILVYAKSHPINLP